MAVKPTASRQVSPSPPVAASAYGQPHPERHSLGLASGIGGRARRTLGDVAALAADEPLPFAADIQHGEIAGADRVAQHREAALLAVNEPAGRHSSRPPAVAQTLFAQPRVTGAGSPDYSADCSIRAIASRRASSGLRATVTAVPLSLTLI